LGNPNGSTVTIIYSSINPLITDGVTQYTLDLTYIDGTSSTIIFTIPEVGAYVDIISSTDSVLNDDSSLFYTTRKDSVLNRNKYILQREDNRALASYTLSTEPRYTPINANFIPVDGTTLVIRDGKLTVIGISPE
jgi:hypothetical protein